MCRSFFVFHFVLKQVRAHGRTHTGPRAEGADGSAFDGVRRGAVSGGDDIV
jgi:hypothetical protein